MSLIVYYESDKVDWFWRLPKASPSHKYVLPWTLFEKKNPSTIFHFIAITAFSTVSDLYALFAFQASLIPNITTFFIYLTRIIELNAITGWVWVSSNVPVFEGIWKAGTDESQMNIRNIFEGIQSMKLYVGQLFKGTHIKHQWIQTQSNTKKMWMKASSI